MKKILFALLGVAAVFAIFAGIGIAARRANATTVKVIPVSDLNQAGYMDDSESMLYGEIASSVTQKVELMQDAIISQVYVKEGDRVKPGDKLLTYDMTLKQLELELTKLRRQSLENKLDKARARLTSLENGGPIDEDDSEDYTPIEDDSGDDREESLNNLYFHAFAQTPVRVAAAMHAPISGSDAQSDLNSVSDGDGNADNSLEGEPDDDAISDSELPSAPEAILYEMLDYESVPYRGSGSKEDPLCFLCTGSDEGVVVKGSFFNKMAGYDEMGVEATADGKALWYRLEFHEGDRISDMENPEASLIGFYLRKGKELMNPDEEKIFTLEGAGQTDDGESVLTSTPEPEVTGPNETIRKKPKKDKDDEDWEDEDWEEEDYPEEPSMTREEAIKYQKNNIQAYELDIQKQSLAISKLEKELKEETATSTMEGIVTVVGDPATGESDGDGFIEIESDDGYYVKGALGELMLDRVQVGDEITGTSYESGIEFTAKIREIAAYPATGSGESYDMGNPNESKYPFMAHVTEDLDLQNGEGTEIKLSGGQKTNSGDSIYLDAAMIRSEGGRYYVYKDNKGELQKKYVTAERSSDGYSIVVSKGLTNDDKIAFPYGKGVEEGAKTEDGTMEELYDF